MKENKVVKSLEQKIQTWECLKKQYQMLKFQLEENKKEMNKITTDLGSFLTPDDAKLNETFNVWYGNGLLQVEVIDYWKYELSWRKRPTNI